MTTRASSAPSETRTASKQEGMTGARRPQASAWDEKQDEGSSVRSSTCGLQPLAFLGFIRALFPDFLQSCFYQWYTLTSNAFSGNFFDL